MRGATVYTLSERASDEEARRMAEKENNSDAIAGLQTAKFEEEGEVPTSSLTFSSARRRISRPISPTRW